MENKGFLGTIIWIIVIFLIISTILFLIFYNQEIEGKNSEKTNETYPENNSEEIIIVPQQVLTSIT